ncbi:hypothetical protein R3X27_25510, partial [Tropicimonas sp. TH_r6]|uniref:hypothetical protein n=1 Tax=Tropicimonas sp. TH_r6 TaxID=3082085 RepID=UPI00295305DD
MNEDQKRARNAVNFGLGLPKLIEVLVMLRVALALLLLSPSSVFAENAPDIGRLYGPDHQLLKYRCTKEDDYNVECDFTEVSFFRNAEPGSLDAKIAD